MVLRTETERVDEPVLEGYVYAKTAYRLRHVWIYWRRQNDVCKGIRRTNWSSENHERRVVNQFDRNDPTFDGYAEWDTKIIELSRRIAFQLVEKGIDVIIDEGFWEKTQRNSLRNRIEAIGAKEVLYYLDTPIETMRARIAMRNDTLTNDSFQITAELFDSYLQYWQPPTEDEDYVTADALT